MISARGTWILKFWLLGMLLLPVRFAGATTAEVARARTTETATGVYALTFEVNPIALSPGVVSLRCRARIIPSVRAGELLNAQPAAVAESAVAAGKTAGCTVNVPFSWLVGQLSNGALVSYEIDAVSALGVVQRTITQRDIAVPAPPVGGTARLSFNLRF